MDGPVKAVRFGVLGWFEVEPKFPVDDSTRPNQFSLGRETAARVALRMYGQRPPTPPRRCIKPS